MNYKNFNRHEAYTTEMLVLNQNIIRRVDNFAIDNDKPFMNNVTNMLYGLYDGYLYDSLLQEAEEFGLDQDILHDIKGLVKAIEMYIQLHGQAVTQH